MFYFLLYVLLYASNVLFLDLSVCHIFTKILKLSLMIHALFSMYIILSLMLFKIKKILCSRKPSLNRQANSNDLFHIDVCVPVSNCV